MADVSKFLDKAFEGNEFADLVYFIVAPSGRFLHGALIDMDGGATKTI